MDDIRMFPVTVLLPGSVFSDESQHLRDNIEEWLDQYQLSADDYDSFYMRDPVDAANGNWYTNSVNANRYICYSFRDSRLAVMFKLAFG